MKKTLIAAAAATLLATTAQANSVRDFDKLDANGDSKLSLQEFLVHIKNVERMTGVFNKRDKDSDGFLTENEYHGKKKS